VEDTYPIELDHDPRSSRLFGHKGHVNQVQFSSDNQRLYSSSSEDKTVKIWDAKTHKEIMSFDGHVINSASFAINADDSLLAIVDSSEKPTIVIWDIKKQRKILTIEDLPQNTYEQPVGSIEFTKDGKALIGAIVSYPGHENEKERIKIWSVATGALLKTISLDQVILYASLSPDEKALLVYGEEGYVGLISFLDGSEIVRFSGHTGRITTAKFSPDGQRVVTGSEDHTLRIWDVATGDSLFVLRGHTSPIANIAFTPDGDRVASASTDSIVKLWDTENGFETLSLNTFESRGVFPGYSGGIAFSRNGILGYSGYDNFIQIHDARPLDSP
tara:strand:- start:856 stop:1845 length:990 start_codon:yes stop_codon:yes gene_type:complete